MEQRQFEQAVQHMIHNEGVDRLTPERVAYKLGIDARNAERMLDRMVTEGSLELDSDDQGNLFYFMPGVGSGGVFTPGSELGPAPQPLNDARESSRPSGTEGAGQQGRGGYGSGPYGNGVPYGAPSYGAGGGAPPYGTQPPNYGTGTPYSAPGSSPAPYSPPGGAYGSPAGPPSYRQPAAPHAGNQGAFGNPYGAAAPPHYGAPPPQHGGAPRYGSPGHQQFRGGSPYGQPGGSPNYQYGPPGVGAAYAYGSRALVPTGYQSGAVEPKSPAIAGILSAIFPGAGQLYNGQIGKGLVFFFVTFTLIMFSFPLGAMTYLWNIFDAFGTSKRINAYGVLPP